MTTLGELSVNLQAQGIPVDMDSAGGYVIKDETVLTQQQIDTIASEYATWDAQTDAQKAQSQSLTDVKPLVIAIRNALNAISDPSAIVLNNDYVVYDTDDTTPLLTVPSDANWTALNNAGVKDFIREFTLTYARVLEYAIAQKGGYIDIKKYIKSELENGS